MTKESKCIWCDSKEDLAFGVCKVCRKWARMYIKIYKAPKPRRRRKKKKEKKKK